MGEKRLFQVMPMLPGSPVERLLLASEEVYGLVAGPWDAKLEPERLGRLWQDFDRFVLGRLITVALDNPYRKPKATYLSRLDPTADEVWEIRSCDPAPAIRVFGRFAEVDTLIVLNWEYRKPLGGPSDGWFAIEREKCKAEWKKLFPAYPPISPGVVHEYVSANAISV